MKNELIELAKEKGFKSINLICLQSDNNFAGLDDELTYYLWLCELQKWLIDTHNLFVQILAGDLDLAYQVIDFSCRDEDYDFIILVNGTAGHKKYEIVLEKGCYEALKLIE